MARSDMFLKATGQRSGAVVGESNDKNFPGQIDVVDWSWGMSAPSTVGGQRSGRTSLDELKIVKRVDKASTALMAVLNTNDVLSTVVLTVRKSGGTPETRNGMLEVERACKQQGLAFGPRAVAVIQPWHLAVALGATLLGAALAASFAALRAGRVAPAEGIRDA